VRVFLVPAVLCDWRESGRLLGRATLPLREDSDETINRWTGVLRSQGVGQVYSGHDDLSRSIGQRLAQRLNTNHKAIDDLAEVDLGLWTGLTDEQLRARFASAWRQLSDAPLTVVPPDGESLSDASARVGGVVRRRVRKNGKAAVAFVLRPIALALAQRALGGEADGVWELAKTVANPLELDPSEAQVAVDA